MYTDEDAVEIMTEDDGNDMTECSRDDKPSLGTFFLSSVLSVFSTYICYDFLLLIFTPALSLSYPRLRKGNINCFCATVLSTIIMVHSGTSSSYRSVDCIGL